MTAFLDVARRHAEHDVHDEHLRLGYRCGNCAACYPEATASWHADARAHQLRTAIVGGVPIDPHESGPGQEAQGLPAAQRSDALAGGSSDGDPAGSGRAIAGSPAIPGRTQPTSAQAVA